jgi:hypothetical protein
MARRRLRRLFHRGGGGRRGALLLLVLLMLALFLSIGVFALTVATRSRTAARAFANSHTADIDAAMLSDSLLNQALMKLVRGPSSPGATNDVPESLLEDMYCGERDLNRNNASNTSLDDTSAEIDIDSGRLSTVAGSPSPLTRSDSLTGRLIGTATTEVPFISQVTVTVYFENDKVDSSGLWIAAQDLNNNGMYDPRPGDITLSGSASPAVVFNGRVITFCPASGSSRLLSTGSVTAANPQASNPVSYRILRSERLSSPPSPCYQCDYRFVVADLLRGGNPPIPTLVPRVGMTTPTAMVCDVIINGPAFRVDPCDTLAEPWIADFGGTEVDNDNDGVADGRWLSGVLPVIRRPDGQSMRCDVSFLVKDLDGRINVNAHGMNRRNSQNGRPYEARREYGVLRRTVPIGMGYGPAEIDASALFSTVPGFAPDSSSFPLRLDKWFDGRIAPLASTWDAVLRGDVDASVSSYPTPDVAPWLQRRPSPVLGRIRGRYGADGLPGSAGQDTTTQLQDAELVANANSPADLKGRRQVATQQPADGKGVATLLFYHPDTDQDIVDDPYEVRLDRDGPRVGTSTVNDDTGNDSVYTVAELERVLRQFDLDASYLPPRLAAALGPRLKEDRDEDGQLDEAEPSLWQQAPAGVVSLPDDPREPEYKLYLDDGEDRASSLVVVGVTRSMAPNGILDAGEDTNGNGYLDLARDRNGSGFRDIPEDRNSDLNLNRYWPKEAFNPADASNPAEAFPRALWERDFTQTLRDLITTDSWDTPGLTGLAAARIEKYLIDNPATIPDFSPDILSGLRFDINRPLVSTDPQGKQDYCKQLFYLLIALGGVSPEDAAQWAVNIIDFRDADSVMTMFRYDPQPQDGWSASTIVFGVERPELVISEAAAWFNNQQQGQLFVTLHRPWNAVSRTFVNANAADPPQVSPPALAEPIDSRLSQGRVELNDTNNNGIVQEPVLDLELRTPAPDPRPVWRLVIRTAGNPDKFVRFDEVQNPSPNEFVVKVNRTQQIVRSLGMPTDSYLCVTSGQPQHVGVAVDSFPIDSGSLFIASSGTVELQRVADPSIAYHAEENKYITVDWLKLEPTAIDSQTNQPIDGSWRVTRRSKSEPSLDDEFELGPNPVACVTNFWRACGYPGASPVVSTTQTPPQLGKIDYVAPWLHWPNRPFVSVGELMVVPRRQSAQWLQEYKVPFADPGQASSEAERLVFDACHVYTRFAGNRLTLTGVSGTAALQRINAQRIPFDQLSRWREPGRVNLYTGTSTVVRSLVAGRLDGRSLPLLPFPHSGGAGPKAPTMTPTATLLCPSGGVFVDTSPEYAMHRDKIVAPPNRDDYVPFNPSQNPLFCFSTAIRMPNVATTRSHVFAVWVTLRLTDTADPSKVTFRRLFAIIDRSIPVGFLHGMNLNVSEAVVLQRYLD